MAYRSAEESPTATKLSARILPAYTAQRLLAVSFRRVAACRKTSTITRLYLARNTALLTMSRAGHGEIMNMGVAQWHLQPDPGGDRDNSVHQLFLQKRGVSTHDSEQVTYQLVLWARWP